MFDQIFNIFSALTLIKVIFLIVNGMYVGFLLVVYKQSRAMQAVVNDGTSSSLLNSIALLNVIIGISIFVAALIVL
ncbi:MAG: hypothetical protein HYW63_02100 [Candidatus Levybacteria bacterium]|nr:hypothetical protein [Candidatus Levybacteria bacterium]